MKLRNKKTGRIGDFNIEHVKERGDFLVLTRNDVPYYEVKEETGNLLYYDNLAHFNEDWEDYTPAEPLIKDEKIRKAVRAWAEIGKYEHIYYDRAYNRLADDYDFVHCIEFSIDPCPDAESGRCYTLTELCGSEE